MFGRIFTTHDYSDYVCAGADPCSDADVVGVIAPVAGQNGPCWLLIYWIIALPHRVNIGYAAAVGLAVDVLLGLDLGLAYGRVCHCGLPSRALLQPHSELLAVTTGVVSDGVGVFLPARLFIFLSIT